MSLNNCCRASDAPPYLLISSLIGILVISNYGVLGFTSVVEVLPLPS